MRYYGRMVVFLVLGMVFSNSWGAESGVKKDSLQVLMIGNSFSQSVYRYLPEVVRSAGCELVLEDLNIGGCSFQRHWENITKEEVDSEYRFFKKYSYREKLQSRPWDVVTVQQASYWSWRPETYQPEAKLLVDFVRKNAPQAEVVIQQTWAYRPDDGRLAQWNITQREMYEKLCDAYNQAAKEMRLRIIPTGTAVQTVRETQPGGYHPFQRADFQYPDLPKMDGFLCGNIRWNQDRTRLEGDAFHLNHRGEYLQACVWFAALYGRSTEEITFVPKELSSEDAAFLRKTAQKVVESFPQPSFPTHH